MDSLFKKYWKSITPLKDKKQELTKLTLNWSNKFHLYILSIAERLKAFYQLKFSAQK